MVIIAVMLFFTIFILGEWIFFRNTQENKITAMANNTKIKPLEKRYYHPGHTWLKLNPGDNTVEVGLDQFTRKIIGHIDQIDYPIRGQMVHQGSDLWTLKRGKRKLTQISPISGKVVEINPMKKSRNPVMETNWLLKIKPIELKQNLNNLLSGELVGKWEDWTKSRFLREFTTPFGPVYQDGGELLEDLYLEISDKQWEIIQEKFFYKHHFQENIERE